MWFFFVSFVGVCVCACVEECVFPLSRNCARPRRSVRRVSCAAEKVVAPEVQAAGRGGVEVLVAAEATAETGGRRRVGGGGGGGLVGGGGDRRCQGLGLGVEGGGVLMG